MHDIWEIGPGRLTGDSEQNLYEKNTIGGSSNIGGFHSGDRIVKF